MLFKSLILSIKTGFTSTTCVLYALVQAAAEHVASEPVAVTKPDNSIAVLPFVNMSSDVEQEYFSDGLSEELLNLLARMVLPH